MKRINKELSYNAKMVGKAVYDTAKGEMVDFQLIAFGQRTGAGPFNGRGSDPGPAPMGVAIRMR